MASVKLYAVNSVFLKKAVPDTNYTTGTTVKLEEDSLVVFEPETLEESLKYKPFVSATLRIYVKVANSISGISDSKSFDIYCSSDSDPLTSLTWYNFYKGTAYPAYKESGKNFVDYDVNIYEIAQAVNKFAIEEDLHLPYQTASVYTEKSSNKPYIEIFYVDELVTATVTGQNFTSGFYNRFDAANVKWKFSQDDKTIKDLKAVSETFYWRKSGTSSWNSIKGSNGQCYVAANTFPAGSIEWYVAITDNLDRTWTSPTYTVSTADTAAIATPQSPKGGFANEQGPIIFSWLYSSKYNKQSKADIQWGLPSPATWQNLATVEGDVRSYTAPAGTIDSAEKVWWRIKAYNADGVAGEWSDAVSFTTTDSAAVGTPLSPSNTVEDGSGPISFSWKHANNTGTAQTAADLQWSSDGATWNDLATINGSGKSYTAPANTFPAGTVYWRVRTYNSDDVAGEWSAPITFVSVAAPPAPVVAADSKPYTTITWQSSGQLAYNIAVDGVEYGPRFGADKSITLKERLENGLHRATVKVQGVYGLWSEAGVIDFQIKNAPGAEIKLKVRFDHAPRLSWSTEGAYSAFQIYRNGKLIGKTTGTRFADNLAIDSCTYQLIGIMADGNYTESNIVKGAVCLPCTMICDLERGEWQKLELSAKSYPERNFSESQNHSSRHFCGAALPVLELSQHRNKSGSYEVAFKCRKDAEAFEKLMGKVVCIKSKPSDMIIGGLLDWQRLQGEFYAAYSFTVNAVYWEDYKDETDS